MYSIQCPVINHDGKEYKKEYMYIYTVCVCVCVCVCVYTYIHTYIHIDMGFPGGSDGKESTCNVGDLGSIAGLGRSPREGYGYPLQYSGLENSMDREPGGLQSMGWQSWTRPSDFHTHTHTHTHRYDIYITESLCCTAEINTIL